MTDNPRPVPIPEACHVVLGVFTTEPLDRDDSWELPPEPLLRRFGASADDLERLAARTHVRLVSATFSPAEARDSMLAARREALALAAANDGAVVDLAIPRIVGDGELDLTVARQWVAFDIAFDTLESIGLAAFGLPEMAWARTTDGSTAPAAIAVMSGLAHRLIAEWPQNDPVGPATVTLQDIASGLGDTQAAPRDTGLEVDISYDGRHLIVTPAGDPADLFG